MHCSRMLRLCAIPTALLLLTGVARGQVPATPDTTFGLPGNEPLDLSTPLGAPKSTPAAIIDTLNKEINAAIADDKIGARLADLGGIVMAPNSPAEFAKFIAENAAKWARRRALSRS